MLRKFIWGLLLIGFATLGASFGGGLHPLGDSLAVFRLHIGAGCLLVSLGAMCLDRRLGAAALVLATAALAPILWISHVAPAGTAGPVAIYQKNMLFVARDLTPLIDDIRATNPDVITLQEVTPTHTQLLDALSDLLPTQMTCPFARVGAVAIASRWPLVADSQICLERQGLAALQVSTPTGPLWLVSIHLHWPWPHAQLPQRRQLLPVLLDLTGPVLIGGDFNMVPWSHSLRAIARASRTRRIGQAFNSMTRFDPFVPLAIDHVLVPTNATGTTELRPLLGSDHHGLLARITLPNP